jgi:hypothetical protein
MDRLANVELQLIMQQLECNELIAFARCNLRLIRLADSPSVWRHATLRLNLAQTTAAGAAAASAAPSRLLRHARTCIDWASSSFSFPSAAIDALQSSNLRLHEFDTSGCAEILPLELHRILAHPQAQHLRVLRFHHQRCINSEERASAGETIRAIVALPHLHTLRLTHLGDGSEEAPLLLSLLSSARSLTALDLEDVADGSPLMGQCASLKHLTLRSPLLYGGRFLAFFTAPSMRQLESLSLHGFFAAQSFPGYPAVPLEDYTAAFASLRSLHTLTLSDCFGLDVLLPHLTAAASLRQISSRCRIHEVSVPPPAHVLMQILTEAPKLSCTITLISDAKSPPVDQQPPAAFQMEFAPVQAAVGGRFSMLFQ